MRTTPYCINLNSGWLTGPLQRYGLLRDQDDLLGEAESPINASNYFSQLATWLDEVCMGLSSDNRREIAKLQRIIDDLFYLYSYYEIKKKK